jgi:hypothetical protein
MRGVKYPLETWKPTFKFPDCRRSTSDVIGDQGTAPHCGGTTLGVRVDGPVRAHRVPPCVRAALPADAATEAGCCGE